jgi:hypothetical protein
MFDEDYLHYFISCPYLKEFWVKIQQILKKSKIENCVTLKHIVFGYKIFDKDYFDLNYFLTILGFPIYKAYYVSEHLLYFHPKFFQIGTRNKVM